MSRDNRSDNRKTGEGRAEELRRMAATVSPERDRNQLLKMADEFEAFARKMTEKGYM